MNLLHYREVGDIVTACQLSVLAVIRTTNEWTKVTCEWCMDHKPRGEVIR